MAFRQRLLPIVAALLLPLALLTGCGDKSPSPQAEKKAPAAAAVTGWATLDADNLHDTANPDLKTLLNPHDALSILPRRGEWGNKVDWMQSLERGLIEPRAKLDEQGKLPTSDILVLLNMNGGFPVARFPHKQHTMWLDCGTCHRGLFEVKSGDTPLTMLDIMEGRYCGQCHGAVAFPVADCARCHAVPHEQAFQWVKEGRCEQRKGKYRSVIVCPN